MSSRYSIVFFQFKTANMAPCAAKTRLVEAKRRYKHIYSEVLNLYIIDMITQSIVALPRTSQPVGRHPELDVSMSLFRNSVNIWSRVAWGHLTFTDCSQSGRKETPRRLSSCWAGFDMSTPSIARHCNAVCLHARATLHYAFIPYILTYFQDWNSSFMATNATPASVETDSIQSIQADWNIYMSTADRQLVS